MRVKNHILDCFPYLAALLHLWYTPHIMRLVCHNAEPGFCCGKCAACFGQPGLRRQDGGRMSELETKYAIGVDKVTKIYKLYDKPIDRLKESLNFPIKNTTKIFTP